MFRGNGIPRPLFILLSSQCRYCFFDTRLHPMGTPFPLMITECRYCLIFMEQQGSGSTKSKEGNFTQQCCFGSYGLIFSIETTFYSEANPYLRLKLSP
jgi:hypothetical protein